MDLVRFHVGVFDSRRQPIPGLAASDFIVTEAGEERPIAHVFEPTDAPVDVVVLVDMSGSMADSLRAARRAASQFAQQLRAGDCLLFLPFAERPATPAWMPGGEVPDQEVDYDIGRRDETVVNDAILVALRELVSRRADVVGVSLGLAQATRGSCEPRLPADDVSRRELIVVVSDGIDSASRASWTHVMSEAVAVGVAIVAIVAGDIPPPDRPTPTLSWDELAQRRLVMLAESTGGFVERLSRPSHETVFNVALTLMRSTYLVAFPRSASSRASRDLWRPVAVDVPVAATVSAPRGYYSRGADEARALLHETVAAQLLAAGNLEQAVEELEQAHRANPRSERGALLLGRAYWLDERMKLSLSAVLRSTTIRPGSGHAAAAVLAMNVGSLDIAVEQAIRAAQAGEPLGDILQALSESAPEALPNDFQARLDAPRVFVAAGTAASPSGFFVAREVDAALARSVSDAPMIGLVTDRSKADYLVWFDVEDSRSSGPVGGEVRLNRPEHINRGANERRLSTRPGSTLLSRLRRWTIKSWRIEVARNSGEGDIAEAVEPVAAALAEWLADRHD